MLLNASSAAPLPAGTLALIACFSVVCLINGVRHYRGRGTWLLAWLPTEASFFAPAWYGALGLMVVVCELAGQVSVALEVLVGIPTLGLFAIALVSLVWLPSRMLPGWYRDQRHLRRSAARAIP